MTTDISVGVRWDPLNGSQQDGNGQIEDYDFEYDGGNSSSRLFERSRIRALAGESQVFIYLLLVAAYFGGFHWIHLSKSMDRSNKSRLWLWLIQWNLPYTEVLLSCTFDCQFWRQSWSYLSTLEIRECGLVVESLSESDRMFILWLFWVTTQRNTLTPWSL